MSKQAVIGYMYVFVGICRMHICSKNLRMSQLRYPTVVIALWPILLTYYLTCDLGIAVHNPEETCVCVIVQDPSSLLRNT